MASVVENRVVVDGDVIADIAAEGEVLEQTKLGQFTFLKVVSAYTPPQVWIENLTASGATVYCESGSPEIKYSCWILARRRGSAAARGQEVLYFTEWDGEDDGYLYPKDGELEDVFAAGRRRFQELTGYGGQGDGYWKPLDDLDPMNQPQGAASNDPEPDSRSPSLDLPHVVVRVEGGDVQCAFGNRPFRFAIKDFDNIEDAFVPTLDAFEDGAVFDDAQFLRELRADIESDGL